MPEIAVNALLQAVNAASRTGKPAVIHTAHFEIPARPVNPAYNGYYTPENENKLYAALDAVNTDTRRRVNVSPGNRKIGRTPSASLLPWVTCPGDCSHCRGICYAARAALRWSTVRLSWARNTWFAVNDPDAYFDLIAKKAARKAFFRWHVAGDIPNRAYMERMRDVARACPDCRFLAFTENHDIVNASIDDNGPLPENLVVWLSWDGVSPLDNRHGLPVTQIVRRGEKRPAGLPGCPGNCEICQKARVGCWFPKTSGGRRGFGEH